ncbi:MAG: hypothetical protein QGG54_05830 [Gammaproteobacteria bacterium]|jgi:hypothetical protein|nr:hypothetical protein [Gammaproteobacteria bacterium]MDP6536806.1 hypothetical protein [Gammaproteobacteria bacterium]MDP6731384.1 hypothetical protein [Gammaproteobacteria bacterium]
MRATSNLSLICIPLAALLIFNPGIAQENPLGQPLLDATGNIREDAFIQIPLREDDRLYADIDGAWMKAVMNELIEFSQQDKQSGNLFWGRNLGTEAHALSQDWAETYFRQLGLEEISRSNFNLEPVWRMSSWDIGFTAGEEEFTLVSARPPEKATSTPAGGLEFELVWLGTGTEADYLQRDVTGKAVLIQDIPRPGTLRHSIRTEDAVERAYATVQRRSASSTVFPITSQYGNVPVVGPDLISVMKTASPCANCWAVVNQSAYTSITRAN